MLTKKMDWGYIIRTAFCALFFIGASTYFTYQCSIIVNNYLLLTTPSSAETTSWLIHLAISATLVMITLGLTIALIRPTWISIATYILSSIIYIALVGSNMATWITAAALSLILALYLLAEVRLFENQIKATTHPLGEKKMLVSSLLALLISVAIGIGYFQNATTNNYVVPPEAKSAFSQYLMNTATPQIEAQKLPEAQKQIALKKAQEDITALIAKQEEALQPIKNYIPYILGILAFFTFQMLSILIGIISMPLTALLFWFLKTTHFIHSTTEKCEVTRLTLKSTI